MITAQAANYAKVLFSLGLQEECIENTREILLESRELVEALKNPNIKKKEKESVINRIFNKEISGFLKVLSLHQQIGIVSMIFQAYDALALENKSLLKAELFYVTQPDAEEINQIEDMLCRKYKKTRVIMKLEEDPALIGGFVLMVANTEYDKSIKGTLEELQKALVRR